MKARARRPKRGVLLAPCPFCGGDAELRSAPFTYVSCSECGAGGPKMTHAGAQPAAQAKRRWNVRVRFNDDGTVARRAKP